MNVVVDASAILAVALQETNPALIAATRAALADATRMAPVIMLAEVAGGIAMAEWGERLTATEVIDAWRMASGITNSTELSADFDGEALFALCRQYRLRGADACYLQLCLTQSASLLTGDRKLAAAAHAAGVPLAYDPAV